MIRYAYIAHQVFQLYKQMPIIQFPINPKQLFLLIPNCRILTYQRFAEVNNCSIREVIELCESKSGCTHYDTAQDRYLVLYNDSTANNNVQGRIRWTLAHELSHVRLKHLPHISTNHIAENSFNNLTDPELEAEADRFAALLLCPMPLFEQLRIQSPADIHRVFGLSREAADVRWREYQKWIHHHKKTALENDLKHLYRIRNTLQVPVSSEFLQDTENNNGAYNGKDHILLLSHPDM